MVMDKGIKEGCIFREHDAVFYMGVFQFYLSGYEEAMKLFE